MDAGEMNLIPNELCEQNVNTDSRIISASLNAGSLISNKGNYAESPATILVYKKFLKTT